MDTYTFGLKYRGEVSEEIDVQADNYSEAQAKAIRIAKADYMPGWELVALPRGGSGGWAIIN